MLLRPTLFVNGRMASNDLLKNTKVTLTTRNATDNMPVSKTFDNLKTLDNREIVIEFQVPSLLSNIDVKIECDVKNITEGNPQKFEKSRSFNFENYTNQMQLGEMYTKRLTNGDYVC